MNQKASILIVDDDEGIRKSLGLIIKGKNYRVETAGTGQEALEKAWGKEINLALVDLKLPDMEGVNLIPTLKEMHPELAVIVTTGFASIETAIQALNKGASAYITKPLNMDELCAKVEEALEKQRLLAENKRLLLELQRELEERKLAEQERESLLTKLSEKNKELEQIIHITSHDLRSPLVNIQGFTRELDESFKQVYQIFDSKAVPSAVRKKLAPILDEDIPHAFQYILASSSKMDSLLSSLLRLSRLGCDILNIRRLDMNKLMSQVVSSFEFQIREAGVTVKVDELPPCHGDETQLNQVFSNLLDNALKFLDPDKSGRIRISGKAEKGQVTYCIEDNGISIADKDRERIFEIFCRLNPDASAGEGLGLAIVRKILDRHGGKVWVESEPGKGSRFFVSLLTKEVTNDKK
jgi:signal transduction histidine kinase